MKTVMIAMLVLGSYSAQAQTMKECRKSIIDSGISEEFVSEKAEASGDNESSGRMSYYIYANDKTDNQDDFIAMCVRNNVVKSCVQYSKNPEVAEGKCD